MFKLDRQIRTVLSLSVAPGPHYELRGYEVHWYGKSVIEVTRTYSQPGMKTEWHECVFVGPRGGCKTIYKSFY